MKQELTPLHSPIVGQSEMAALIRSFDWHKCPLGPIEQWPVELVSAVNLLLTWPSPMTLYWGPEFCLIYNDGYKQFLAGKHPESLGAPARVVWQEMWEVVEPDFMKVFTTGAPVQQRDIYLPAVIDGRIRDEWWTYTLSPLYVGAAVGGILNLAENRTAAVVSQLALEASHKERDQAMQELAGSERRLQIALRTARLGTWQLNLQTMQMQGSEAFKAAFGRAADADFRYEDLLRSLHPEDLPRLRREIEEETTAKDPGDAEYRVIWPDGTTHWLLLTACLLAGTETTPPMSTGVVLDVTERHRTLAALIQSEKLAAVGRLASSIAHEINNPLEAVTNLIFLSRDRAISPEVRDYLAIAERELQRMGAIANQTLRFHKQASRPTACHPEDLIDSALTIYEGKLVRSHVQVSTRQRAPQPVRCFEGEIRQVLSNLIGNAIDAMHGRGGRLILRSREGTDWRTGRKGVVLAVADTGTGMSAVTREHLFEAFYTTKGMNGTGLGLWISAEIVHNHDGRLLVKTSEAPGKNGTVFTLFLPFEAASRPSGVAPR